ncbi:GNAT family N-acetyltransferase [Pedobacter ginsengisoli]|uniref:GNAT family N-acetyltransferase n=1 Tax=Pedobacter ginsengisoli TaxID=363852 RepID=UPI00254B7B9E|nr:GNAT family N-acetyltransferase [Pedobacter ginsengisoli]
MIETILDNPIWFSLLSRHAELGEGTDGVKLFHPEVAPFAGLRENTPESFQILFDLADPERVIVLFSPEPELDPSPWTISVKVPGNQMVFRADTPKAENHDDLQSLTEDHIQEMLALTQLAQPGPFLKRTIEFGNYRGIFEQGKLVAMAGHRLQSDGFTEISAVCTHPGHSGKGHGRKLLEDQVRIIRKNGNTPYLHVRSDNVRAIQLYQWMGFMSRTDMYFYILKKESSPVV